MLEIHVDERDRYSVCRPVGELDAFTVGQFREALSELSGVPALLIDLSGVPFLDSAGLGAIVSIRRRLQVLGGKLVLAVDNEIVLRLLKLTSLDRVVPIHPTAAEALEREFAS